MRCAGELYVSGGTEEYAEPEWSYVVRAVCNGGATGCCGFDLVVDEEVLLESGSWGITSTDMEMLQHLHILHSMDAK